MELFLSWSGSLSNLIAKEIKTWLQVSLQHVKPFMSEEDIAKGTKWNHELSSVLEKCQVGIICLTKENIKEPWIMFEAGAISKNVNESRVFTILFNDLKPSEVAGPLVQFQHTSFNKDDIWKLFKCINFVSHDTNKLEEYKLKIIFDKWWPDLESKINGIQVLTEENIPTKTINEVSEEILLNTRSILMKLRENDFHENNNEDIVEFSKFNDDAEIHFEGRQWNHPIEVRVFPVPNDHKNSSSTEMVSISKLGVRRFTQYPDLKGRGCEIELVMWSEENGVWSLNFRFHKGMTYLSKGITKVDKDLNILLDNLDVHGPTIWRD